MPRRILIAPLDWGLGHATRCIPIINEFIKRGCLVQIASSSGALTLLKEEYPGLRFHEIVSYDAHYSKILPLPVSLFFQIPKFLSRIKREHHQIDEIVREERIDFVISDNRYGCWTKQAPSIFVTHQVNILMPLALKWLEPIVNYFNHRQIKKFDMCWVPDYGQGGITGKMTETKALKTFFIGMLSRFEKINSTGLTYDLLVLVSGPEPHRTTMEKVLLEKLKDSRLRAMLVRGVPGDHHSTQGNDGQILRRNHMNSKELNAAIVASGIIISRSGYSTIMDLAKLNKKAILIPTPGQTEQLYLARRLSEQRIAYCTDLAELGIDKAVELSASYSGFKGETHGDLLASALNALLK